MTDNILKLRVESSEYDAKLKKAAEGIRHLAEVAHKGGGELTGLEKAELDYVKALGSMETKSRTAAGSVRELESTYKELKVIYDQLNDVEKADEGGKALAASLEQIKQRAQEARAQLDTASKSLNDNGQSAQQSGGILESLAGKFTLNIDALKLFDMGLSVTKTALNVAKDAFFATEGNIDEWGRTVKGAEGAYDVFLQTLNNGNWSNFFSNISQAITGARDLYDAFDRLNSIKANNAVAIATTQAEIQQLRLLKQQGQNVDDKIKEATKRLASLQSQSANAGVNAGRTQVINILRNGVNSIGGARINDATLNRVADNISKQGQDYFDYMKRRAAELEKKGMVTKNQTINDSQGGTYERQYKVFDINALSKEQQKQYAISKTVTERETEIQKGLSTWSQAVQEQTSNTREQFKSYRYALQGSGDKKSSATVDKEAERQAKMLAELRKEEARAAKIIADERERARKAELKSHQTETRGTSGFNEQNIANWTSMMKDQLSKADFGSVVYNQIAESMKDMSSISQLAQVAIKNGLSPQALGLTDLFEQAFDNIDVSDNALQGVIDKINEKLQGKSIKPINIDAKTGNIKQVTNDAKVLDAKFQAAAQSVQNLGSAMSNIQDPSVKVMGTIAQAIASIALGFAQATSSPATTAAGVWGWIAAVTGGLATMISTIASIHSATGYAQGGIVDGRGGGFVGGTAYSGDNVGNVRLDSGELVLNRSQQSNLANHLQDNERDGGYMPSHISGEQIWIAINRYTKRTGQGEVVTWK